MCRCSPGKPTAQKLVKAKPMAHMRIFVKDMAHCSAWFPLNRRGGRYVRGRPDKTRPGRPGICEVERSMAEAFADGWIIDIIFGLMALESHRAHRTSAHSGTGTLACRNPVLSCGRALPSLRAPCRTDRRPWPLIAGRAPGLPDRHLTDMRLRWSRSSATRREHPMTLQGIIIRADGVIAETDALERSVLNQVVQSAGFNWTCTRENYTALRQHPRRRDRYRQFVRQNLGHDRSSEDFERLIDVMTRHSGTVAPRADRQGLSRHPATARANSPPPRVRKASRSQSSRLSPKARSSI